MPFFQGIQSFRLRNLAVDPSASFASMATDASYMGATDGLMHVFRKKLPPHSSHPNFANLTLLVFEAVLEVVCVSAPGYIVARMGMFDAENQKFLANLNTQLFTPCLIFTKLASQLSADKLVELGVIPFIFVVQMLVSFLTAVIVSKMCGFSKRAKNFVVAMAVFGNSNSLPISLVISLSKTLSGLHWDRIPRDNDNEVAARGILYLLIFQQLGQLVRWTWGFNVLLAPASAYKDEDLGISGTLEQGEYSEEEADHLLGDESYSDYESGNITPELRRDYATSASGSSCSSDTNSIHQREDVPANADFATPTNGNAVAKGNGNFVGAHDGHSDVATGTMMPIKRDSIPRGPKGWWPRFMNALRRFAQSVGGAISRFSCRVFSSLPKWLQRTLSTTSSYTAKFFHGLWEFMNPPLWAMLVAIVVASVPQLQHLFFAQGTFVSNSVTRAVNQSGQVAVPLILVVLGANLARNTLPKEDAHSTEDPKLERKLVIASLVSRMLLPTIIMAPLLALTAKFVPVSILDDPIFVIVCFLLTGAPSALQLAQICQINNVYMGAMSRLLFQSYVVWILPSTLTVAPNTEGRMSTRGIVARAIPVEAVPTPVVNLCLFVSIAESASSENVSSLGKQKKTDTIETPEVEKGPKQFRASISRKRLSGRPSVEILAPLAKVTGQGNDIDSLPLPEEPERAKGTSRHQRAYERLSTQINAWLHQEKSRRSARKAMRAATKHHHHQTHGSEHPHTDSLHVPHSDRSRRHSEESEGSVALEDLQNILQRTLSLKSLEGSPRKRRPSHGHRISAMLKRNSIIASDTDYFEGAEDLVPSCEAVLDNSKTLAYTGGSADSGDETAGSDKAARRARKEKEAWDAFKYEIVRITHTLKLKGWRRVPLDYSSEIEVQRLSGALTNAVYVVTPPANLPSKKESQSSLPAPKNPPPKLLLRIYGPQVEHLIDRDAELQILKRLARKRIGPRLLGTFINGRFEEYYNAKALTFADMRVPETSVNIAKRMRELHEGIELLRSERDSGPFVWKNWDKWVDRCEQIVMWLDQQTKEQQGRPVASSKLQGFVCGVEWALFRKTIEKYRAWLEERYGGITNINQRLVFAHNDAQYGNILRLEPAGESPLLLPANEHKQLVVIDFEYANANLPGLEFANHFTEWCYNYHSDTPHACNTRYYPTTDEQSRFIRAYLTHNPAYRASSSNTTASNPSTPRLGPLHSSGSSTALAATAAPSSISAFMLDSRAPPGDKQYYADQEAKAEQNTSQEIKRLMAETRLWRLANSAQWTAWGIVQANIPGMPGFDFTGEEKKEKKGAGEEEGKSGKTMAEGATDGATEIKDEGKEDKTKGHSRNTSTATTETEAETPAQEEEEFDYLAYANDRAMFLWGDAVQLGIVRPEELPEELRKRVKFVEY
ncbi:kinase-like protein [Sporormia fimetaria CBS 119925]|uniref:Kinase-like protein n=1 Tax=Sporormia fimetaria CBS 119925 TaxID=1340428 RepID=A0A6A6VJZ5_9PLEO|nr:kinase-like protein [Sporormia fimetaria CBS 119925]